MLDTLGSEIRVGLRQLRRSPAFTFAAVVALSLGIGANATVFTWWKAVALDPLPGVNAAELYSVRWQSPEGNGMSFSWPDYRDYVRRSRSLASLAVNRARAFSLGEGSNAERVWGALVSANYFDTMGVHAAMGRTFTPDEDGDPDGHAVTVISYALWQRHFHGDAGVIGREVRLNQRQYTIAGVMPERFGGSTPGLRSDLWVPASMQASVMSSRSILEIRGQRWLDGLARLRPGGTATEAQKDLSAVSAQMTRELSGSDRYPRAILTPIWKEGGGRVLGPVMLLMMVVVGVVLLIACANISNLLLARASGRRREVAIRMAVGASRARLVRMLLVESTLLAAMGAIAALAAAPITSGLLQQFVPASDRPISLAAKGDASMFGYGLAISALAALLCGLAPALRASRSASVEALKDNSAGSSGQRRAWLRNSLVVAQVAMSLVLLACAGLLLKSLDAARTADPGFDPHGVLVAGVDLSTSGYDTARGQAALARITERIAAIPGVVSASTVRRVPLSLGGTSSTLFTADGYVPGANEELTTYLHTVGPAYFRTMRTPLLEGRDLAVTDSSATGKVIVVNQTFARKYLNRGSALGSHVRMNDESYTVVGVAKNVKFQALNEPDAPAVYYPVAQEYSADANFLVRTAGDPLAAARAVERAIHETDPNLPVFGIRLLEDSIGASWFAQKLGGSLLAFFGSLALLLAAVGMYGMLAFTVAQRTRELGIRMALGASRQSVTLLVLGQAARLGVVGLAIGIGLALAAARLMRSLLFGVSATDAATLVGVSAILIGVMLVSAFAPVRRATRISPLTAIRYE